MPELSEKLKQLLRQPIPVLSNVLIKRFMEESAIRISPFDPALLGPTEYRLCAHRVRFLSYPEDLDGAIVNEGNFLIEASRPYIMKPHESILMSIAEEIDIPPGMVAEFYASSECIDNQLHLVAGRLHHGYKHAIVFGIQNAGEQEVKLHDRFQVARITFCWLGLDNMPDYSKDPGPAAYVKDLSRIRKRERQIEEEIEQLRKEQTALKRQISG